MNLHDLERQLAELLEVDGAVFRRKAEYVAHARDLFKANYSDGWKDLFHEWCVELGRNTPEGWIPTPLAAPQVSELLLVADNLPQDVARELPASRQKNLARALRDGVSDLETLLEDAEALSASSFAEKWLGRKVADRPKVDCPIGLKCSHRVE